MPNTTARFYCIEDVVAALERLIRLGMARERAIQVVGEAFPEHRSALRALLH